MATLNVYECYYASIAEFNEVPCHGALVMLIATSEEGHICYEAAVTFLPHNDEEDFVVSYDAYFSKALYEASGCRFKKREQVLLGSFRSEIDQLAMTIGGKVLWDQPLREEKRG